MLKSKVPIFGRGGGVHGNQFPTFDAESKFAKIQSSHGGGGGGGSWKPISNFQLLMLSSNLLKSKIPMSGGGGGGVGGTNFQLLMLSSNLLKSKIPMSGGGGGGGGWWNQLSTFDAEFKFAKIQNSDVRWGVGQKCEQICFRLLSTKWFAFTKYRRTTIIWHLGQHPSLNMTRDLVSTVVVLLAVLFTWTTALSHLSTLTCHFLLE